MKRGYTAKIHPPSKCRWNGESKEHLCRWSHWCRSQSVPRLWPWCSTTGRVLSILITLIQEKQSQQHVTYGPTSPQTSETQEAYLWNCSRTQESRICISALSQHGFEILPHLPYSSDSSPCDFQLFPQIKRQLKDRRFKDIGELKQAFEDAIAEKPTDFFEGAFQMWRHRAEKCMINNGD